MTRESFKILVADDDAAIRTVLTHALTGEGYDVEVTDNGAKLFQWVAEGKGDLVITDVMMPGENGLDLIPKIHRRRPDLKVIVVSAQNALTTAISASEKGAVDFIPKPFDIDLLMMTVKNALRRPDNAQNKTVDTADAGQKTFVVGHSRAMQDIYRTIARLRSSDLTVLLSGESGTGKEVIARALHQYSRFSSGPFVAVNMAAIPRELIESALFGHEKGAFTGATQKTVGYFEQAAGGTLFLDEIGDMPFEAQTRLLRVLQEGEFTTVGGRKPIQAKARIIAATNKNLRKLITAGLFREDLYYRLNVVPMSVPPLRERNEDIEPLVQHFMKDSVKVFTPEAMGYMRAWQWPGNIRELENLVRRICALYAQDVIDRSVVKTELSVLSKIADDDAEKAVDMDVLVDSFFKTNADNLPEGRIHDILLRQLEKPLIEKALLHTNGNQIKAAEILGLNRNTLRKKIRELEIAVRRLPS